jgi:hypothetical protein
VSRSAQLRNKLDETILQDERSALEAVNRKILSVQ